MTSRRKFLTGTATTGAAALALSAFPPSIRRALAIPANNKTGTIMDVEHVVILMQENRAFDHYFGTLKGVRGFGDRITIPLPGGLSVWQQLDDTGSQVLPYHLDSTKGNAQRVSGTPHTWIDSHRAWDGGRLYQWPRYKKVSKTTPFTQSMGYLTETELPFHFALANAFTICDDYHCAMHAGTHANRSFHWTGTNGPTGAGVAYVNNVNKWAMTGPSSEGYEWKTYAERLQEANVSWLVYQNISNNFGCNPLLGFRQYRRANEASAQPVDSTAAQGTAHAYAPGDGTGNPLYKGTANTLPVADQAAFDAGAIFDVFRADVKAGRLPQVSWIIPPDVYSEHPGPSSPVQGAWYIQQALDALTAVPEVWSKTVLFVNFDENDGYFDHVPSASAPSPVPSAEPGMKAFAGKTTMSDADLSYEYFNHPPPPGVRTAQPKPDGNVYGPGMRVPMLIISPWSRGGWVDSQTFDHTSVLRFLEARFGVKEDNISPFRRAVNGDLTSAFNFATPNEERLPTLAGRKSKAEADQLRAAQDALPQITPPTDGRLPVQAPGTRPSRALPYELHANAKADTAGGTLQLLFANTGSAAAVFHVYDKLHLDRLPRRYMVEAGKSLDDTWAAMADDAGAYDLWVLGPNGFHRHFKGKLAAAAIPEVRVRYDAANGHVHLRMRNDGTGACTFTVTARAYRKDGPWTATVKGGASAELRWDLSNSGQWYDFAVTCDTDPGYYRRFAGRMETGRHSVSDPAIGLPDL